VLGLNLEAAGALGLGIPSNPCLIADEVID